MPSSDDDALVRFLSAPVPRPIPKVIRKGAFREKGPLRMFFTGVFLLAAGMGLSKVFVPWRQLDEWRLAESHPAMADGVIVSVADTGGRIGGGGTLHGASPSGGNPVMSYRFKFTPAGQVGPVFGECFTTGYRWTAGNRVRVRYDPARPELACPTGARLSESPLFGAVVLIFPIVGMVMIVSPFWLCLRTLWLLKNGAVGDFRVTAIEPILIKVKGQMQPWMVYNNVRYKITLQRVDQPDAEPHEVRWWQPKLTAFARERQASGQAIFGIFDPAKPKKVLLPEAWLRRK